MDTALAPLMPYVLGLVVCSAITRVGGRVSAMIAAVGAFGISYLLLHR